MSGVRILCNQIIPVTDWNHDYVTVASKLMSGSPLPALACFDLLNPLDNSGHGYKVTPRGGQIRDWGLHYDDGAIPSITDFAKAGQGAVSFITAFKLNEIDRYITILSNQITGAGFNLYYSAGFYMAYIYPSGSPGTIAGAGVINGETDKWYVACGTFDSVNKTASVRISDAGLQYGTIGTNYPANTVLDNPLVIGGGPNGSTTASMNGDIAFAAYYDGAFTASQRDAMISVGQQVLRDRGLIS